MISRLTCVALVATAAFAAPNITGVYNAATWAPVALPNSGIAQGSIFTITGTGLGPAALQQALSYPLPTSQGLAGTRVQVTVGGVTEDCVMIYTLATQVAAILPSPTPVGTGNITLSYQDAQSSFAITVLAANFGLLGLNEAGNGPGVFTDAAYQTITLVNAAHPGEVLIAWGTGLGPVSGGDNVAPQQVDLHTGAQVFVGGLSAQVLYGGRASSAGLDQINFEVPAGVFGCKVSVAVAVNGITSNFVTLPLAPAGQSACSDSTLGLTAAQLQAAQSAGVYRIGALSVSRLPNSSDKANAAFASYDLNHLIRAWGYSGAPSLGSCAVYELLSDKPNAADPTVPIFLDAGPSLGISGSSGAQNLSEDSKGSYSAKLGGGGTGLPTFLNPGTFTITGPGGADVGAFSASLTLPQPVSASMPATISRDKDLTIAWTGSTGNAAVLFIGANYVPVPASGLGAYVELLCLADPATGQFTIPSYVMASFAPNGVQSAGVNGIDLDIASVVTSSFSASGIDTGIFYGIISETGTAAKFE